MVNVISMYIYFGFKSFYIEFCCCLAWFEVVISCETCCDGIVSFG
ncbi:hypothetical protein [uncultured Methanobrevibacter sp.]|nr:hypothetical protein [uncultured Methanobrevibacter sp.]